MGPHMVNATSSASIAKRGYHEDVWCGAGLVNEKTVHVEASTEGGISITRTLPKHANKPKHYKLKTNKKGKNFRRTAVRLGKEVHGIRPDLKVCALIVLTLPVPKFRYCMQMALSL